MPFTRQRPDKKPTEIDLRPFVAGATVDASGELHLRLLMSQAGTSARPEEVVDALGLRDLLDAGAILARTDVELASSIKESSAVADRSEPEGPAEDAEEPRAVDPTPIADNPNRPYTAERSIV